MVAFRPQLLEERNDAVDLVAFGSWRRAGTGRLAADVNDVGSIGEHLAHTLDRAHRVDIAPAVEERIGSDIEHAHDQWAIEREVIWTANKNRRN